MIHFIRRNGERFWIFAALTCKIKIILHLNDPQDMSFSCPEKKNVCLSFSCSPVQILFIVTHDKFDINYILWLRGDEAVCWVSRGQQRLVQSVKASTSW